MLPHLDSNQKPAVMGQALPNASHLFPKQPSTCTFINTVALVTLGRYPTILIESVSFVCRGCLEVAWSASWPSPGPSELHPCRKDATALWSHSPSSIARSGGALQR